MGGSGEPPARLPGSVFNGVLVMCGWLQRLNLTSIKELFQSSKQYPFRGEPVEVLSSCPVKWDYPGVPLSEAPIPTRMETQQCKESRAVCLRSN